MSLDTLAREAEALYPGKRARYVFWEEEEKNKVMFDVVDAPDAPPEYSHYVVLNEYTGEVLGKPSTDGLMNTILELHTDMFAGIPGILFLGLMGILFVIALVSGVMRHRCHYLLYHFHCAGHLAYYLYQRQSSQQLWCGAVVEKPALKLVEYYGQCQPV